MDIKRGEIYFADVGRYDSQGSEQSGRRPVLILQNDIGNKFSPYHYYCHYNYEV